MNTPKPLGPYTPVVTAGPWLICSGQIGMKGGQLVEGGVVPQLQQALANVKALLEQEDAFVHDIVKTTVFLTDIGDFAAMNEAYTAFFGDHRPARSAVAVAALPGGAAVEVEAWAYTGE